MITNERNPKEQKMIIELLRECIQGNIEIQTKRMMKKGLSRNEAKFTLANLNEENKAAFARQTVQLYNETLKLLKEGK